MALSKKELAHLEAVDNYSLGMKNCRVSQKAESSNINLNQV